MTVKVWDIVVRCFHWALVSLFAFSFISGENGWIDWHSYSGYTITSLIGLRLIWGIVGTKHARFQSFVCSPKTALSYMKSIIRGHPERYLGHNPAGAWMILALLTCLTLSVTTGMVALAVEEFSGPMLGMVLGMNDHVAEAIAAAHEFFTHLMLVLIGLHVAGVILASVQHRENLVRAMWTGRKKVDPEHKSTP